MNENAEKTVPENINQVVPEVAPQPAPVPEPPKVPEKSPEQVIREKELAKAEELKGLVGKSFSKKGGGNGVVKVMAYGGIRLRQVSREEIERAHTLVVESYGARWLMKAKEIADDYEEVKVEQKPSTQQEAI